MITKKEAIAIAENIAYGGFREINMLNDVNKIHCVRGAVFAAADNIWYDVLPLKTREQFVGLDTHHQNYLDIVRNILDK